MGSDILGLANSCAKQATTWYCPKEHSPFQARLRRFQISLLWGPSNCMNPPRQSSSTTLVLCRELSSLSNSLGWTRSNGPVGFFPFQRSGTRSAWDHWVQIAILAKPLGGRTARTLDTGRLNSPGVTISSLSPHWLLCVFGYVCDPL